MYNYLNFFHGLNGTAKLIQVFISFNIHDYPFLFLFQYITKLYPLLLYNFLNGGFRKKNFIFIQILALNYSWNEKYLLVRKNLRWITKKYIYKACIKLLDWLVQTYPRNCAHRLQKHSFEKNAFKVSKAFYIHSKRFFFSTYIESYQ